MRNRKEFHPVVRLLHKVPVPLSCPACWTEIPHNRETVPRNGQVYRCSLCRLELVFDVTSGRLRVPRCEHEHFVVRPRFARRRAAALSQPPSSRVRQRGERRRSRVVH